MSSDLLSLEFGVDTRWEVANSDKITSFLAPNIAPLDDLKGAVETCLANPIEFPSMDQAVMPGDNLVFALDGTVPRLPEVLGHVMQWFNERGTPLENMGAVLTGGAEDLKSEIETYLSSEIGHTYEIELHDPDDEEKSAYLGANGEAEAIYVNRTVFDADVVLPIVSGRSQSSLDYWGSFSVFPLLSNRNTIGNFYRLNSLMLRDARTKLHDWAEEAARCTGFMTAMFVIPAGYGHVGAILAGANEQVDSAATIAMSDAWCVDAPARDLAVALVDGGANQSWLSIARALWTADKCTADHGAIAVCTSSKAKIGKSLARLRSTTDSPESLAQKIANDKSDDAIAASIIQHVTASKHVYLASKMRSESIESLLWSP